MCLGNDKQFEIGRGVDPLWGCNVTCQVVGVYSCLHATQHDETSTQIHRKVPHAQKWLRDPIALFLETTGVLTCHQHEPP